VNNRNAPVLTGVKIPEGLIEFMKKDIEESKEFRNQSEYLVAALRFYEDHRTQIKAERKNTFRDNEEKEIS